MNDAEIRERLRAAVGEQSYPADFSARAETRLKQPPEVEPHPRAVGLVAAILAIAIIAALFGPRLLAYRNTQPRPALPPSSVVSPSPAAAQLPEADLAAAGLGGQGDLVTPLQITKQFGNSPVTVIGAYADPARTVLFFRAPNSAYPMVSINDDYGFINASSSGNGGAAGDYVFILDAGPRPGADGNAHLKVSVTGFQPPAGSSGGSVVPANWTFSFVLPLQQSILVAAVPQRFLLGTWTVTLEVADATPSVVRAQVLIDGVSVGDIGGNYPVTLVDGSGKPLVQTAASASVTVPKGQLDSSNYKRTRLYAAWKRPALAGTYQLRFEGSGAVVKIPVNIPAPNTKGGTGPGPTDFPAADQALTLSGSLTANITTGHPSQCGFGTGPSGAIFAFATYFQSANTWYWLGFYSDPSAKQYTGPGTYTAIGSLYAVGANGPDNVLYKGTVQLTVTSDGRPDTGSVNGTLTGLEVIAPQSQLTVSGSWTCTPGPNLGPG
jgi:hypothetical protein